MQLQINSLSKRGFQKLENFCNQTNIIIKYNSDATVDDLYDVTIPSIECQALFRTSVCQGEELIAIQDFNSKHAISIDSSEFHKVVII